MTIYQILCLVGIPSLISCINAWILNKTKNKHSKLIALESGVQALLRSQLTNEYNVWMKKGYAPLYVKDNFENCWKQYHNLGANGVMDGIHNDFMKLPISPSDDM